MGVARPRKRVKVASFKLPSIQHDQAQRSKCDGPTQATGSSLPCSLVEDSLGTSALATSVSVSPQEILHMLGSLREHMQAIESEAG